MTLKEINASGTRLERLRALSDIVAGEIDLCDEPKSLSQLVRQYRETLKEIEELEGKCGQHDEISEILKGRVADGKPGAVR